MTKNKLMKRLIATMGAACLCVGLFVTPVATMPVQAQIPTEEPGINPMSDIILWVYKIEDGKYYKRLFNFSSGEWVGDWIYVRDAD